MFRYSSSCLCPQRVGLAALLLAFGSALPASATDYTWTGAAGTPNWGNRFNWSGNLAPIAGAETRLIFAAGDNKNSRNNLADDFLLNAILFTDSGYRIRGSSLSFTGTSPQLVQTVSGTNTLETNLSITSLLTANVQESNGNLVLSGALSGADATLTKTGLGKLTLNTSSSKTLKQLNVNGGTVALTSNATLTTTDSYIGQNSGSTGKITVDGIGSKWNSVGATFIGYSGTGTLDITNGGSFLTNSSNEPSYIGYNAGSVGTVTVDGPGSTWKHSSGDTTYTTIGYDGTGTLAITNGGTVIGTSVFPSIIAYNAGSIGTVSVDGPGSTWSVGGYTYVGVSGTGTLAITGGGTVINSSSVTPSYIGFYSGSIGTVSIDGAGSTWNNSASAYVGYSGTGTINITNGGTISLLNAVLGNSSSSKGSVTVDGAGSQWNGTGDIAVGYNGTGTLEIKGGGTVKNKYSYIGQYAGSKGTVTVDGAGSTWNSNRYLYIGDLGTGDLTITNGGVVNNLYVLNFPSGIYVGNQAGSQGSATVDGAGSQLNSATIHVGEFGTGTLAITNGGTASSTEFVIGSFGSGPGSVTVDGAGSQLISSQYFIVGDSGNATVAITNGGLITSGLYAPPGATTLNTIGLQASSSSSMTVDGAGSQWINHTNTYIGALGTGTLAITRGGAVSQVNGTLGGVYGSLGSVTVDGTGSQWNSSGYLHIGDRGTGNITITHGGTVTSDSGSLGYSAKSGGAQASGDGKVTVDGAGAQWNNTNNLSVGESGTGTVAITNGGLISQFTSFIGSNSGSIGTVTVDGTGSQWNSKGDTFVGYAGTGTLAITNGGTVNNEFGYLANSSSSVGKVTVDGAGSTWNNRQYLAVANNGTGTIAITNGGTLNTSTGIFIGANSSANGTVTVDGAGSQWNNGGVAFVGYVGTGTLAIKNGGTVKSTGDSSRIGHALGSNGSVTVDGTGSQWDNDDLDIGYNGTGKLTIVNGAVVNTNYVNIGSRDGSGNVTVRGAGSTWNVNERLLVGAFGTGTLNILQGGTVSVANDAAVGEDSAAPNRAVVDGAGSTWNIGNTLGIGDDGTGTLDITRGGTVNSLSGFIAHFSDSGIVNVRDLGSTWNNQALHVGYSDTGTLAITNRGTVNSDDATIGYYADGNGSVTVNGSGSTWNNTNNLVIGVDGTGSLTITNDGSISVGGQTSLSSLSLLTANHGILNTGTLVGTGKITLSGGISGGITLNQTDDSTFDGTINGNGSLSKAGVGTLTLSKSDVRTGTAPITVQQGGLTLAGNTSNSKQIRVQNGATLRATNGINISLSGGQITADAGSHVNYDNATITSGTVSGSGAQSVTGAGATFNGTQFANTSQLTTNTTTNLISVTNRGTITANSGADIKASNFTSSNGKLNINTGAKFTNIGTSALTLSNGSQTNIGTKEAPGGTLDSGGKDILLNGGILVNNGAVTGGGALEIGSNATLKGSGDFTGMTVNIGSGGVFSPGNSPGIATAGDMIWGAGGTMLWEINDANGTAGTGYDFTSLSGSLSIQSDSTPGNQFTISLASLLPNNTAGALTNFDPTKDYTWTLLHADNGISGFDSTDVTLSTQFFDVFNPGVMPKHFNVEVNDQGKTLQLNYVAVTVVVPESNSSLLLLIGIGAGAGYLLLRVRQNHPQENK